MIIGGHIVTRKDGGPLYNFGQTISIYPNETEAKARAERLNRTEQYPESFRPMSTAAVELRIIPSTDEGK